MFLGWVVAAQQDKWLPSSQAQALSDAKESVGLLLYHILEHHMLDPALDVRHIMRSALAAALALTFAFALPSARGGGKGDSD